GLYHAVFLHIVGNVGDMYAHFPPVLPYGTYRERIVEILGIGRVDGKGRHAPEVAAAGDFFGGYRFRYGVGRTLHLFGIPVRQIELGQYGVHFGIVVARGAQHIDDFTRRRLGVGRPLLYPHHDLIAVVQLHPFGIDEDVVGHLARIHSHERMVARQFHPADIAFVRPLNDFGNLSFGVAVALAADDDQPHHIVLQGMVRIAAVHIDVLVETFHLHIGRTRRYEVYHAHIGGHLRGAQPVLAGERLGHPSFLHHAVHNLPGTAAAL